MDDTPMKALETNLEEHLRILIVGASGSGKSTIGNLLLGEEAFKVSPGPHLMSSTTVKAQLGAGERCGQRLIVLDTPDLADITNETKAQEEVERWKVKLSPEPHLIIFVIRRDTCDIVSGIRRYFRFKQLWGANSIRRRLLVLFTFPGEDIDDVRSKNDDIQGMLREAGKRYFVFNKTSDDRDEEEHLVQQIITTAKQLTNGCTLLIIGKTGNGKSTVGNILLGSNVFSVSGGLSSSTTATQTATSCRDGVNLTIIDTPDVCNMDMSKTDAEQEIKEWQNLNPDVVLLAIRCDVRYTAEEFAIVNDIRKVWGDNLLFSRLVVAFTFGDRLDGDIQKEVIHVCKELQAVLRDCSERYVVFNSHGTDDDKKRQVQEVSQFVVHLNAKKIVLLGLCGRGKSVTGDIILGKQVFHSGEPTLATKYYFVDIYGLHLQVFDTPGLSDDLDPAALREKLTQCLAMTRPGPHAVLYVARKLDSDVVLYETLRKIFGNKLQEHFVLVEKAPALIPKPQKEAKKRALQQLHHGTQYGLSLDRKFIENPKKRADQQVVIKEELERLMRNTQDRRLDVEFLFADDSQMVGAVCHKSSR